MKGINGENARTNESQAFTESVNLDIWVVPTLNQLLIRGSFAELNFQKKKVIRGKTPLVE